VCVFVRGGGGERYYVNDVEEQERLCEFCFDLVCVREK